MSVMSVTNIMTERGHIFWCHTFLSKISFNLMGCRGRGGGLAGGVGGVAWGCGVGRGGQGGLDVLWVLCVYVLWVFCVCVSGPNKNNNKNTRVSC